ncbi:hypothetical protein DFR50_12910 [Roseiarcus fermentans]|uniref:DUF2155 domain-containing protein n=1 Tax=Roseiarcus fermentans TaxID=1473586 RepID=A0A366EZC9_9HYPH|nr:DUF2155 domain-containing protein [Roseiarcus fermentans]RBP07080.1 hypothetical protein DFR50_12910 [Roseiarcus fermentans]
MISLFASAARVTGALASLARRAAPAVGVALCIALPARADKIANPIAVFDGLDKITGRIITFEVALNETVQFGTLQVTPRICWSRPPTDPPRTDAFAQVDEVDEQHTFKRIFSGWMFADSPGLHGVEHPIYDVWLVDCKGGTTVTKEGPPTSASAADTDVPDAGTDANGNPNAAAPASPQVEPAPPPKKKPKPKAPAVVAAPLPGGDSNAPLDLGGAANTTGNARSGR